MTNLFLIVFLVAAGLTVALRLGNVRIRFFKPFYSTISTLDSDLPTHSLSSLYGKVLSVNMVEMKGAPAALLQKLRDLQQEIHTWKIEASSDPSASIIDPNEWLSLTNNDTPRANTMFLSADIALNYLLWRISTTIRYNETEVDLFLPWKGKRLTEGLSYIEDLCGQLPDVLDLPLQSAFPLVAVAALYGSDPNVLSFIEKSSDRNSRSDGKRARKFDLFSQTVSSLERSIVTNDIIEITDFINRFLSEEATFEPSSSTPNNNDGFSVNIIPSCAGRGLIGDLVLAELLLAYGTDKVALHCSQIPNLDGIPTRKDVIVHIQHLANPSNSDIWALRHLGESLNRHIFAGRIVIEEHDMILSIPDVIVNPSDKSLNIVRNKRFGQALAQQRGGITTSKEDSLTVMIYMLTPEELTAKQVSRYRADATLDYEPMPGMITCY